MISTKGKKSSLSLEDVQSMMSMDKKDFDARLKQMNEEADKLEKARQDYTKAKDLDAERKKAKAATEKLEAAQKELDDGYKTVIAKAEQEAKDIVAAAQAEADHIKATNDGYDEAKKQAADDLAKQRNEQANITQQMEKELADLEGKKKDLASAKDTYDSKVKDIVNFAKELQRG